MKKQRAERKALQISKIKMDIKNPIKNTKAQDLITIVMLVILVIAIVVLMMVAFKKMFNLG